MHAAALLTAGCSGLHGLQQTRSHQGWPLSADHSLHPPRPDTLCCYLQQSCMHKNRMVQMKSWAVALTVDTPYRHNRNSPTATSLLCRIERCASSSMTEGSCCHPFCSSSAQPNIRSCVNWEGSTPLSRHPPTPSATPAWQTNGATMHACSSHQSP